MEISKNSNRRRAIFTRYSNNLHMLVENGLLPGIKLKFDNTYLCPLCLNQFPLDSIYINQENHLTLEDVPIKKLGGSPNILTCKRCNNTSGSGTDIHLFNRIKELQENEFLPGTKADVLIKNSKYNFKGTIKVADNRELTLTLSNKSNNQNLIEEYNNKLFSEVGLDKVEITVHTRKKIDKKIITVAILKTVYLLVFKIFGYSFILDSYYDIVRRQIKLPKYSILESSFWSSHEKKIMEEGVYLATTLEHTFIFTYFSLSLKENRYYVSAIFPFPFLKDFTLSTQSISFELSENKLVKIQMTSPGEIIHDLQKCRYYLNSITQARIKKIGLDFTTGSICSAF